MHNDGSSGVPDMWSVYLASTDSQATATAATAHGAQPVVPPMPVGDLGSMAVTVASDAPEFRYSILTRVSTSWPE